MANFAVRLVHGPGWDPARPIRQQDGWDGHAAFMDGLVDDGFIILGGPVGEGNPPEQTLHAVKAADEDEIRTRLARDPWNRAGCCESGRSSPGRCGSTAAPVSQRPDQRRPPGYRGGCQPIGRRRSHQGASGAGRGSPAPADRAALSRSTRDTRRDWTRSATPLGGSIPRSRLGGPPGWRSSLVI